MGRFTSPSSTVQYARQNNVIAVVKTNIFSIFSAAYDTRLWRNVSLRPEVSGLHVGSLESLLALISVRFGPSLRYIELPIELITHTVLHELAAKCPNLTYMLLDFSTGGPQCIFVC